MYGTIRPENLCTTDNKWKRKRKAVKNDAKICTYMYPLRVQLLPPDITNEKPLTVEAENKISIMLIRNSL